MIKVMALLTRKPGLTLEQFDSHWHKPHGIPLTLNIEGIRHSVQNARLADADDLADAPFDGIPEVWLDDLAAAAAMQEAPGYKEADEDQQHFMDIPKLQFLLTEEDPVDGEPGPGDADGVNVIRLLRRADGVEPEQFAQHSADAEHGKAVGAIRHIRSRSVPESYVNGGPAYDVVRELWFEDLDAVRAASETEAWNELMNPDGADPERSVTYIATQRRLR